MTGEAERDDGASAPTEREGANEGAGTDVGFEGPTAVSVDERIDLTITDVPVETVDIRVSLTDRSGRDWAASATYDTPAGTLDLESATSADGEITGGVIELVQRATPAEGSDPYEPERDGDELTVRVERDGEPLGSTTIEREFGGPGVESEPVDGESFVGRLYEPPGKEPAPAVIVLHGSSGEPADGIAQLLASHGFAALALQYFDWQGRRENLPTELVAVPLESVENAVESVRERDGVRGPDVGLFGTSKGGELALLVGSRLESVGPVVSVNGSGVVWAGISRREFPPGPSWTADDEPVSSVPYTDDHSVWDVRPPMEMEPGYSQSLEDADEGTIAEATIPVESIAGPVLLVSGGSDRMWDSVRLHDIAVDRLERHDCDYEHLVYPDAGHAITVPYLPTADRERTAQFVTGGSADGYAEADRDHWPRVLETFETLRT
ncbi:acyl-CoA thioester hydrolase/BAAT C-terminal domain-containing protein [Haloterrigena salinisoli]|uniref:acyl-CoA thioester hydrolase/BAAT C-terminal domain-containing protein n=1 Tax=Haloterrigena salinisoli TaxID=3132747 RepID=UPI0030CF5777